MSNEDEGEVDNSPNDDSKIESTVLLDDVSNSTGTASKRKRSGLDIPTSNTSVLPTWVAGKILRLDCVSYKAGF